MHLIVIDMETYYDPHYSLSKVTTEDYIRHELFEVIGVSVKVDDGETEWFSGTKKKTSKWLANFDWSNSIAVAHNAMFDMAILNWHFDIRPKRIADTLSMARALYGAQGISLSLKSLAEYFQLGAKGTEVLNALGKGRLDFTADELARYGEYCINDTELTYELFKLLADGFPMLELRLIDLTLRMFTEPVLELDKEVLTNHLSNVKSSKDALMAKLNYDKASLMSNPQLAGLLEFHGVVVPMKVSPANGKQTYAFAKSDEAFKELLEHENPQVQAIVAARLGVKSTLEETRTERFLQIAERGTLPVPLRYYAAHTGRWGGDDKINMQNLPRKSPLKKAMRAPDGYLLVDCDSSQIEARTLAWMAGQDDLVEAFDKGEDVYKIMAASIYGKPVEEITEQERFVGKTTILGAGYGMGAPKFKAQLLTFGVDMDLDECKRIINVYRETYPAIPQLWEQAGHALEAVANNQTAPLGLAGVVTVEGYDGLRLPNGLRLQYLNLRYITQPDGRPEMVYDTKKGRATIPTRIYGGKCVENVCQALARTVIGEQMLMIARRYKVAMTVHDSVVALVPEAGAAEARKFIEDCMRVRPKWALGLPLNCESKIGASYGN
jgi:DNA polymerase I-like protein with 3'-5' exonuclease and polymerase domains